MGMFGVLCLKSFRMAKYRMDCIKMGEYPNILITYAVITCKGRGGPGFVILLRYFRTGRRKQGHTYLGEENICLTGDCSWLSATRLQRALSGGQKSFREWKAERREEYMK
jgi:hypothetical protein